MKVHLAVLVLLLPLLAPPASAEDKGALRVTVQKITTDRETNRVGMHRRRQITTANTSLRVDVKNLSMKDLPAATVEYTILLERRGPAIGTHKDTQRGTAELLALRANAATTLNIGDVQLTKDSANMRETEMKGWKLLFKFPDGSSLVFQSPGYVEPAAANR